MHFFYEGSASGLLCTAIFIINHKVHQLYPIRDLGKLTSDYSWCARKTLLVIEYIFEKLHM